MGIGHNKMTITKGLKGQHTLKNHKDIVGLLIIINLCHLFRAVRILISSSMVTLLRKISLCQPFVYRHNIYDKYRKFTRAQS